MIGEIDDLEDRVKEIDSILDSFKREIEYHYNNIESLDKAIKEYLTIRDSLVLSAREKKK